MLSQELTELINFIEQRLSTAPGEHNNPTHTVNSKGRNTKKAVPELSLSSMKPTFSLFDVAANLSHFKDPGLICRKAMNVGVSKMFLSGYTLESNHKNVDICNSFPDHLYCGFGIHPYNVSNYELNPTMKEIERLCTIHGGCIGETGLDGSDTFPPIEDQVPFFEEHVKLALRLNRNLYLHERKAHDETIGVLRKYNFPSSRVLIHCFTGNENQLLQYIEDGYYLSLSGFITKKKVGAEIRSLVHKIPMNRIMIESDAPYMHLADKRVKKLKMLEDKSQNEPVVLPLLLEAVANCYEPPMDPQKLAKFTYENACKFFIESGNES